MEIQSRREFFKTTSAGLLAGLFAGPLQAARSPRPNILFIIPKNAPVMAADSNYELKGCYDLEFVGHPSVFNMPEEIARRLKHGYYASVSYIDACLGRMIDGLKALGLEENTIVVVWGRQRV